MLSGKGDEDREKATIGLISKTAPVAHFFCTFLCHCFHDHNVKLPETS